MVQRRIECSNNVLSAATVNGFRYSALTPREYFYTKSKSFLKLNDILCNDILLSFNNLKGKTWHVLVTHRFVYRNPSHLLDSTLMSAALLVVESLILIPWEALFFFFWRNCKRSTHSLRIFSRQDFLQYLWLHWCSLLTILLQYFTSFACGWNTISTGNWAWGSSCCSSGSQCLWDIQIVPRKMFKSWISRWPFFGLAWGSDLLLVHLVYKNFKKWKKICNF